MENEIKQTIDQQETAQTPITQNPESIQQENTIIPIQPPKVKKLESKKIIIIIFASILLLILIVFIIFKLFYSKSVNDQEESLTNQLLINCNLSGQSPNTDFVSGDLTFSGVSQGEDIGNKVIARLLHKDPAIVEILDYQTWPDYSTSDTLVKQTISNSDKKSFESLGFRDIFETERYSYYVAGIELGIGSDFYKVKKLSRNPTYYHQDISSFPLLNRNGRLIRYKKLGDDNELVLFRDGKVYFRDSSGTLMTDKKLTQNEIDELLKIFASSNYENLENSYNFYEPSIMLVCNRFQNVSVKNNEENLKPIIDYLEYLISSFESDLSISISYRGKESISVKEWPFNEISIDSIKALHDEALAYYRQNGNIQTDNIIYTVVPQDFLNQLPGGRSFTNQRIPNLYFRENDRVFYVSSGTGKCIGDPCRENTFYILHVKEIATPDEKFEAVNLWPKDIGIDLSINQKQSVEPTIYSNSKEFFDRVGDFGVNNNFIDDKYLYRNVGISKTETDKDTVDIDDELYLLKIHEKYELHEWIGPGQISDYTKGFMRKDDDDSRLEDLSRVYPDLINKLTKSETSLYFKDGDKYYRFLNLYGGGNYSISVLPLSKTTSGFTGYSIWNDDGVKLADIPEGGLRVTSQTIDKNQVMLQFRTDRYFIEDNFLYILDLSNEPVN